MYYSVEGIWMKGHRRMMISRSRKDGEKELREKPKTRKDTGERGKNGETDRMKQDINEEKETVREKVGERKKYWKNAHDKRQCKNKRYGNNHYSLKYCVIKPRWEATTSKWMALDKGSNYLN